MVLGRGGLAMACLAAWMGQAAAREHVVLQTRPGVTEAIDVDAAAAPVASVVLFPGGSGVSAAVRNNFLIRVAPKFAAMGITAAVADAPSDHAFGLSTGFRASAEAAADAAAIAAWLKARAKGPVWVIGTSRGSISAANVAVRLGRPAVAGVVLTSSVWADGMEAVPLQGLRVPALIVHNRDDSCRASPFEGASAALARLTAAPAKEVLAVAGGSVRGDPCGAMSPHGYLGIEDQVVPAIVGWIGRH